MLKKANFKQKRNQLEGYNPALDELSPNVPDSLFVKCPHCSHLTLGAELDENQMVCPKCGYHMRLPARKRLYNLCDGGTFQEWDAGVFSKDPLSFPGYQVKVKSSRLKSREMSAVVTGRGEVGKISCALFAMEGQFMMGSMDSAVGEKITRVFERALEKKLPVIGFTVSGGARMQEGILSLMQMAKTSGAVKRHSDAGLLYVTVLTNPTTGGVTASFAMEGDILLAEPGALRGFAAPRVIEQTMRQKLPKGFQSAEFLLEKGFLDDVVPRSELKGRLTQILRLHQAEREG